MNLASHGRCPTRVNILQKGSKTHALGWKVVVVPHSCVNEVPSSCRISVTKHLRTTTKRHIAHHIVP